MHRLVLIKHARPQVDPAVPSEEWTLGPEGRDAAARLAQRLSGQSFPRLYTSDEPKALQTARILAQTLGAPVEQVSDLREHDRRNVPHMDSREFISLIALFFKEPGRLVLGDETADEAAERFLFAVDGILKREAGDVAIVSHGTVISLFAHRRARVEPFGLWRRMGQPSLITFDTTSWKVLDVCERV